MRCTNTIKSAFDGLQKLGIQNIAQAVSQIGNSVPFVTDIGRLIRRGLESIKRALDALVAFIGSEALGKIKEELSELWAKIGKSGKAVLEPLLGVDKVRGHIKDLLTSPGLSIAQIDQASNALGPLSSNFTRDCKLLRFLVNAIALSAGVLSLIHIAVPWLPLALGAAYLTAIGSTLVVGGDYTGGWCLLGRVDGVEQLAEHMRTG